MRFVVVPVVTGSIVGFPLPQPRSCVIPSRSVPAATRERDVPDMVLYPHFWQGGPMTMTPTDSLITFEGKKANGPEAIAGSRTEVLYLVGIISNAGEM